MTSVWSFLRYSAATISDEFVNKIVLAVSAFRQYFYVANNFCHLLYFKGSFDPRVLILKFAGFS